MTYSIIENVLTFNGDFNLVKIFLNGELLLDTTDFDSLLLDKYGVYKFIVIDNNNIEYQFCYFKDNIDCCIIENWLKDRRIDLALDYFFIKTNECEDCELCDKKVILYKNLQNELCKC